MDASFPPVTLPAGTDAARRDPLVRAILDAEQIVRTFAAEHGWAREADQRFFNSVEVFSDQARLWQRILEIHQLPPNPLPTDGLMAGIEGGVLLALLPEVAAALRPEYATQPDFWTRLIAHEVAHRLHVTILAGDEDAMGPQWFYEGFAVIVSGQDLGGTPPASLAEALEATRFTGRGSYARWGSALTFFMQRVPLPELVRRAGEDDFAAWLQSLDRP